MKLINRYLNRTAVPYTEQSWIHMPFHHRVIAQTEKILQELMDLGLLPVHLRQENLAYWLLHESPLLMHEKEYIRVFLFEIDYY